MITRREKEGLKLQLQASNKEKNFRYYLRFPSETIIDNTDQPLIKNKEKKEKNKQKFICCSLCLQIITSYDQKIEANGLHHHTFANPEGIIYEIVCFKSAPGCEFLGDESFLWSWFQGYSWKVAVCKKCLTHIGWLFTSAKDTFCGLIDNRLLYLQ